MRFGLIITYSLGVVFGFAQIKTPEKFKNTYIFQLQSGDSVIYYQCRVQTASVSLNTGQTVYSPPQQTITVTEKFVIVRKDSSYLMRYFVSGFTSFPNRKFSGLKIKERPYWNFGFAKEINLFEKELQLMAAFEINSRPTTEYDFAITKYTTNQLIIKAGKKFEQVLPLNDFSISKSLKL